MPRWTKRRRSLRAILEGRACVQTASVHDPVSARIARASARPSADTSAPHLVGAAAGSTA